MLRRVTIHIKNLERSGYGNKAKDFIPTKILLERTDEENPLSTTQLINILNDEYGISA